MSIRLPLATMTSLFSITAMFILFREALEAAVVISVLLQLCAKMKMHKLQKWGASPRRIPAKSFFQTRTLEQYPTLAHMGLVLQPSFSLSFL